MKNRIHCHRILPKYIMPVFSLLICIVVFFCHNEIKSDKTILPKISHDEILKLIEDVLIQDSISKNIPVFKQLVPYDSLLNPNYLSLINLSHNDSLFLKNQINSYKKIEISNINYTLIDSTIIVNSIKHIDSLKQEINELGYVYNVLSQPLFLYNKNTAIIQVRRICYKLLCNNIKTIILIKENGKWKIIKVVKGSIKE